MSEIKPGETIRHNHAEAVIHNLPLGDWAESRSLRGQFIEERYEVRPVFTIGNARPLLADRLPQTNRAFQPIRLEGGNPGETYLIYRVVRTELETRREFFRARVM